MGLAVKLKDLYFKYNIHTDRSFILQNINIELKRGEYVVIAGRNGSGKSTLLKIIDLIYPPDRGEIYIFDTLIDEKNIYEARKRIGLVFQNPDTQLITGSVMDELAFGLENVGLPPDTIKSIIEETVEITGIKSLIDRRTDELSGGEKQLVALASVLAMKPDILLLDEPFSMINVIYKKRILKIIEDFVNEGKTVVLVSHNFEAALNKALMADRYIIMQSGRVEFDGTPSSLFTRKAEYLESLGLRAPLALRISSEINKNIDRDFPICSDIESLAKNLSGLKGIELKE